MKNKDGLWISKNSIGKIVYNYLFNFEFPEDYLTSNMDEARTFNWFSYGFFKFILESYDIKNREAFIVYVKV